MLPTSTAVQTEETQGEIVKPADFTDMIRDKQYAERFADIWGLARAKSYIQSVILLYRADEKLHVCTPHSIISAALRAAACELQVDPFYRQAYLIPRNRKIKARKATQDKPAVAEHYITEANFQPHYHGLEVLAHRTNLYRVINVSPIYKGQRVLEDIHTGLHYFTLANAGDEIVTDANPILAMPSKVSQLRDATSGRGSPEDVIGYLAYFETFKGQKKTEWMTVEEIEAHAKKYSDAYTAPYSLWAKGNPHRPVMQMKTCFIRLTKSMDLSGREHEYLLRAVTAGDEAQQAALEEAGMDGEDVVIDLEPRYQTDEFSQDTTAPVSPVIVNTTPVTTGGQTRAASAETRSESHKPAAPLPTTTPVGRLPLAYSSAKEYFIGPKKLQDFSTEELKTALESPTRAESTKNAIRVVLEWREKNPSVSE
jgi:recombination protein RecT